MAMETLAQHLGTWEYRNGAIHKVYSIVPQRDGRYTISWSKSVTGARPETLAKNKFAMRQIENISAREALRRIRDKARGGYAMITPYSNYDSQIPVPDSAYITVAELSKEVNKKANKVKSATEKKERRRFDFMDWLGGKE
jgi:hypothetical protein